MNREKLINALETILEAPKEELEKLLRSFLQRLKSYDDQRTLSQNDALHLGLSMVAKALNEGGNDMRKVLKPTVHIDWDTDSVKHYLFKSILKARFGKDSTTKLKKIGEIDVVWDTMMRYLLDRPEPCLPEYIPFPNDPSPLKDTQF